MLDPEMLRKLELEKKIPTSPQGREIIGLGCPGDGTTHLRPEKTWQSPPAPSPRPLRRP